MQLKNLDNIVLLTFELYDNLEFEKDDEYEYKFKVIGERINRFSETDISNLLEGV